MPAGQKPAGIPFLRTAFTHLKVSLLFCTTIPEGLFMKLQKHITDEKTGLRYTLCGDYDLSDFSFLGEIFYLLGHFRERKVSGSKRVFCCVSALNDTFGLIACLKTDEKKGNNGKLCDDVYGKQTCGSVGQIHIVPTKRWAALSARKYEMCGAEYLSGSVVSKCGPVCSVKVRRE
jgi:hypothetical protein